MIYLFFNCTEMNGRRVFREYAQSLNREAKEFVEIKRDYYHNDTLYTKDNSGKLEETQLDYKDIVMWMIRTYPNLNKN